MDRIFFNGNIHTMEPGMPLASAVAVKNGLIVRVGGDEEVCALADAGTEMVDLHGALMVPGFSDSHMHLLSYGYSLEKVDLNGAGSMDELIRRGKEFLAARPYLTWLQGRGWNTDSWEDKRFPNRYDLDKITTDIPMFYTRSCAHIIAVNSKALEVMGITRDTAQIPGGQFDLDENGEPLGIFREEARNFVYNALPDLTVEDCKRMMKNGAERAVQCGLTAIQTDDFEAIPAGQYQKVLDAYRELRDEGQLKLRIYEQCLLASRDLLGKFLSEGHYTGEGDAMFRIGPLKLLADGSLGGRTAFMQEPYADDPTTRGIAVFTQEELDELIWMAHSHGMTSAVHCIGDGTAKMYQDAVEKAQLRMPRADCRCSIIHCQITDRPILERFKKLNLNAHIQPAFIDDDMYIVADRVGPEKEKTSYNWKTLKDLGVCISGGSDSPVISFNVMNGIYCAVTRRDLSGKPAEGWLPDQKLTVDEAVYAYTMGGAYCAYDENVRGSIRNGKYADFAVLDTDIFTCDPEQIKSTSVVMTVLGGKTVYQR